MGYQFSNYPCSLYALRSVSFHKKVSFFQGLLLKICVKGRKMLRLKSYKMLRKLPKQRTLLRIYLKGSNRRSNKGELIFPEAKGSDYQLLGLSLENLICMCLTIASLP